MLQLKEFYSEYEHFFITFKRPDTESLAKKERVFFAELPRRNVTATLKSFFQTIKIIRKEKPDLVISTGADSGLVTSLVAKLMGKKVVFIESFCRPSKPGLSGKIVYHFADLFIYQWREMEKVYPRGIYGGSIF